MNATSIADLYAYQFDLQFNPAVLAVVSVAEGPFLRSAGTTLFIPGIIDNTAGSLTVNSDSLVGPIPGATGAGVLETVQFRALANGLSPLNLSNVVLLDSTLSDIAAATANSAVTVGVPEPGTWAAVALGIGLLFSVAHGAKRKRQTATS